MKISVGAANTTVISEHKPFLSFSLSSPSIDCGRFDLVVQVKRRGRKKNIDKETTETPLLYVWAVGLGAQARLQSCTVARSEILWRATYCTIKLGRQNGRLLHWPKCSCVSTKNKLWKLLLQPAVCTPSLLVQRPARICHFSYCAWLWNRLIRLGSISYPKPSSLLLRVLDENEGSGKNRFLGDPDWSSEM